MLNPSVIAMWHAIGMDPDTNVIIGPYDPCQPKMICVWTDPPTCYTNPNPCDPGSTFGPDAPSPPTAPPDPIIEF